MSAVLALDLISRCAIRVGDPGFLSVAQDSWLDMLNEVAREMCQRMRLKKRMTTFSLEANNAIYTYPENMVQLVSLEYNPTPTDPLTWRKLNERFRDEFEEMTNQSYPTAEPTDYYADLAYLYLVGMPTADLADGCRTKYWALPDNVTNPSGQYLPVPDSAQNVLQAGMLARGYQELEKYDVADRMEQKYERLIAQTGLMLEDRSDDRRQSLRPRSSLRGFAGQV